MAQTKQSLSYVYSKNNDKSQDEKLLQPFTYITRIPGKSVRSKLTQVFNYWLNVPEEKMAMIGNIVEMLHNASLLLDDIEDNSVLRRGVPVAHSIYGTASTINAANYVLFIALEKVLDLQHPQAARIYTEQALELHRGQGMDIYWRDNYICPTEEEYKQMITRKTGGLFLLPIRLMQLFSENQTDFSKVIELLGLIFQIRDDYLNLHSDKYMEQKSYCEDLTEGKFSFPLIHAIRSHPDDTQVIDILRKRTHDFELKKYCVSLLEKYGSFKYTEKVLGDLKKELQEEVKKLDNNPYISQVLDSFFKME